MIVLNVDIMATQQGQRGHAAISLSGLHTAAQSRRGDVRRQFPESDKYYGINWAAILMGKKVLAKGFNPSECKLLCERIKEEEEKQQKEKGRGGGGNR